jgi:hypothetical protein
MFIQCNTASKLVTQVNPPTLRKMMVTNATNIQTFIKVERVPLYFRLKTLQGFRSTPKVSIHTTKKSRVGLFTRGIAQSKFVVRSQTKGGIPGRSTYT